MAEKDLFNQCLGLVGQNLGDESAFFNGGGMASPSEFICQSVFAKGEVVIQIKRKFKRKRKQKRNRGGHLRGGASRPSRRLPRLRFCFRFRLNSLRRNLAAKI